MFMLILMCIKKKKKEKEQNTFRILSIRVPWTSTTKHGDANLFVSFDILRYLHGNTQCKHVSTSTVPSVPVDTQRVTLLINPFCLMNII